MSPFQPCKRASSQRPSVAHCNSCRSLTPSPCAITCGGSFLLLHHLPPCDPPQLHCCRSVTSVYVLYQLGRPLHVKPAAC